MNPGQRTPRQYAAMMVLPTNEDRLDPHPPAHIQGDVLMGNNYIVARPHLEEGAERRTHTEKLVLDRMHILLHNYIWTTPPTVLLYTRGTPCAGCTNAIINTVNEVRQTYSKMQFVVAYTTNMVSSYMTPTSNCENRNRLRLHNYIDVYCVQETRNQCREDDSIPCAQHDVLYGRHHG